MSVPPFPAWPDEVPAEASVAGIRVTLWAE